MLSNEKHPATEVVQDEFCVMRGDEPHPAYSTRATAREVLQVIKWDGHKGLSIGHRTRTVITTAWATYEERSKREQVQ